MREWKSAITSTLNNLLQHWYNYSSLFKPEMVKIHEMEQNLSLISLNFTKSKIYIY